MDLIQQRGSLQVLQYHFLAVLIPYHIRYRFLWVEEPEDLSESKNAILTVHLCLCLHLEERHGAEGFVLFVLCLQGFSFHLVSHHCIAITRTRTECDMITRG